MRGTMGVVVLFLMTSPLIAATPLVDESPFGAWHLDVPSPMEQNTADLALALDNQGHPHIAVTQTENKPPIGPGGGGARVLVRNGLQWEAREVKAQATMLDIAIDAGGQDHVVLYHDAKVWYASALNGWAEEEITAGRFGLLLITSDATIHVLTNAPNHGIKWMTRIGAGSWVSEIVAASNRDMQFGDLEAAADGRIFALVAHDTEELFLETRSTGGTWSEQQIPACLGSPFADLAVAPSGIVHVVCEDLSTALLDQSWDGSSWTTDPLPTTGDNKPTIALDSTGAIGIASVYRDSIGPHLGYYSKTALNWTRETVDAFTGVDPIGQMALKFDTSNRPHIAYTAITLVGEPRPDFQIEGELRYAEPISAFAAAATGALLP